jgi:hypothetical protein
MRKLQWRKFFVIIATISIVGILASTSAVCQSGPQSVLISTHIQPPPTGKTALSYAAYFEEVVESLLQAQYPCMSLTSTSGIAAVLKLKSEQALLGVDPGDLSTVAGALGAKYVIDLTITDTGSGPVGLTATMTSNATLQKLAMNSSSAAAGNPDAVLDAIEALAKQFVDSLSSVPQFSPGKCNPTNPWAGTITYRLKQSPPAAVDAHPAISGKGTVTTTTTNTVDDQISIRMGWTGPPRAEIMLAESYKTEEVGAVQMDCGRPTIASNQHNYKSGGWDHMELMENFAYEEVGATVSVEIANGRYKITLHAPPIQGQAERTVRKHNDGGCGTPNDDNSGPTDYSWDNATVTLPMIDQPLDKPDTLLGSETDAFGGEVFWNLKRTPMRK